MILGVLLSGSTADLNQEFAHHDGKDSAHGAVRGPLPARLAMTGWYVISRRMSGSSTAAPPDEGPPAWTSPGRRLLRLRDYPTMSPAI